MNDNLNNKTIRANKANANVLVSCLITLIVFGSMIGFVISLISHVYWFAIIFAGSFLLGLDFIMFDAEFEKKRKRNFIFPLIILTTGAFAVACGIMLKINPDGFLKLALKNAPLAAMILIFIIGIGLILSALSEEGRKRRYCTVKVRGVCVKFQVSLSPSSNRRRSHAPVYEFYYADETHQVAESSYSNFANPKLGEEREIYVDTISLDEIYEPIRSKKLSMMTCILGVCFVSVAILGLIMVFVLN